MSDTLGARLRRAREQAGLSVGQAAMIWVRTREESLDDPQADFKRAKCHLNSLEADEQAEAHDEAHDEMPLAWLAEVYAVSEEWLRTGVVREVPRDVDRQLRRLNPADAATIRAVLETGWPPRRPQQARGERG